MWLTLLSSSIIRVKMVMLVRFLSLGEIPREEAMMAKKNATVQRKRNEKMAKKANRQKAGKRKLSEEKDVQRYAARREAPKGWTKSVKRDSSGKIVEVCFYRRSGVYSRCL